MPETWQQMVFQLLVAGGGLALIGGGAKAWWTEWCKVRQAKRDALANGKKSLEDRVDKLEAQKQVLWEKVESQLMDARAYEREMTVLRAERLNMDRQLVASITAMIAALERSDAMAAKLKGGSR